eukprot:1678535-Amphidinium_carterae.1
MAPKKPRTMPKPSGQKGSMRASPHKPMSNSLGWEASFSPPQNIRVGTNIGKTRRTSSEALKGFCHKRFPFKS